MAKRAKSVVAGAVAVLAVLAGGAVRVVRADSEPVAAAAKTKAQMSTSTSTSTSAETGLGDSEGAVPGESPLKVARFVIGTGVSEREPVGVAGTFPKTTGKLFAFVEVENPTAVATTVELVWIELGSGKELGHYTLDIGAQKRWRTWGRKSAPKQPGEWAAVLRDEQGLELARAPFAITE